jgi:two-component system, LytTR family, sensor kinase
MKKEIRFDVSLLIGLFIFSIVRALALSLEEKIVLVLMSWVQLSCLFYLNRWLIVNYVKKKKWLFYLLGLMAFMAISTPLMVSVERYYRGFKGNYEYATMAGGILLDTLLLTAVHFAYESIMLRMLLEKTKRQQVQAELKLLQSQVNPHFLFNTLNNIYAQNFINSPKANEMIGQLADLMRYQIESAKKVSVPIQDEITFIENYLALERKRLIASIKTNFALEIAEELDTQTVKIPPMLFIPFIENAYKHGISTDVDNFIFIGLNIKNHSISFKIENRIPSKMRSGVSTKTGLENIKKRLHLLFPDKHHLTISTYNHIYNVQLEIKL